MNEWIKWDPSTGAWDQAGLQSYELVFDSQTHNQWTRGAPLKSQSNNQLILSPVH